MKKCKILLSVTAAILALLVLCSCTVTGKDVELKAYDGKDLHMTSDKETMFDLLNELNKRLLRYDDETKIGDIELPEGNTFNMGWQTSSLVWHNATAQGVGSDKITPIYANFLKTMAQDDYGYIYDNNYFRETEFATNNEGLVNLPQGWPFPYWKSSVDNPFIDGVDYGDVHFCTFEFDSANDPTSEGWTATNGSADIAFDGYMTLEVSSDIAAGQACRVYNDKLNELLTLCGGIDTAHAAFVEIDLDFASKNLDDYYIVWQTKEGGDTWYRASSKQFVTTYNDYFVSYGARTYWPMYLSENWSGIVTALGVEFVPQTGEKLDLTNARIKYIRPSYDTRQPQFTFQWLQSFYNYVMYTRDTAVLKELMPKARRAIMFLLHCLNGESGLLNVGYLYGHNGIGTTINADGSITTHPGQGIGSSYWDVLALPQINLEANAYFYECVKQMAVLEKVCETQNITTEATEIKNRAIGGDKVAYTMTSETLDALAANIRSAVESDIKPQQNTDGSWTNVGGLWNPETGRFALGVREDNGKVVDHGYVYFNEQAIVAGLGTEVQQKSIMQWIDGQRTVETDLSKGKDIYFYEFAPRFSTADNSEQINFPLAKALFGEDSAYKQYGTMFSHQVQNGGAVLCWSYYDVIARAKVLGVDNAYKRIEGIVDWYKKVKDSTDGEGTEFFRAYYDNLADNDAGGVYVIQNADDRPGAIGLDAEFLENAMLAKIVPDALFGMQLTDFDVLSFTNNGVTGLKKARIDNLKFGNVTYSVTVDGNSLEIGNLFGAVYKDTMVQMRFVKPSGSYKVYVNGTETTDYTEVNGYVVVTVKLSNVKVTVK